MWAAPWRFLYRMVLRTTPNLYRLLKLRHGRRPLQNVLHLGVDRQQHGAAVLLTGDVVGVAVTTKVDGTVETVSVVVLSVHLSWGGCLPLFPDYCGDANRVLVYYLVQ